MNSDSGLISGKASTPGTYSFTVQAVDSAQNEVQQALTLTVDPAKPVAIKTKTLPGASESSTYSANLVAEYGTVPYSWSVTAGSLPPGLTLGSDGSITGQPTQSGTFDFTVQVSDSSTPAGTATKQVGIYVKA
jgi:hypothetical protein